MNKSLVLILTSCPYMLAVLWMFCLSGNSFQVNTGAGIRALSGVKWYKAVAMFDPPPSFWGQCPISQESGLRNP